MPKDISIKELRANLAKITDRVVRGETFRVIRRSKPAFYIVHIPLEEQDLGLDDIVDNEDKDWETIADFTEGGATEGAPIENVLKAFKELEREDGQN